MPPAKSAKWPVRGRVRRALLRWFDLNRRDLPWRRTRDPYAIWVSEVMLQQTQVATVIPYWLHFLERFPTLEALARARLEEVLEGWKGLGYYSRARHLKAAAEEILAHHQGKLPRTAEALSELPGFGRYTSGAVASIAFGEQAPVVDGNVARVLCRLAEVGFAPGSREREARLWELASTLVRGGRPGDLNQALMELGALVCRPKEPTCPGCPLRRCCGALARGRVAQLPLRRPRPLRKRLAFAVGVARRKGEVLLGRREDPGLFGGLWELPCAPLSSAADPIEALAAAMGGAKVGPALAIVRRTLTHRNLELRLFRVTPGPFLRAMGGYRELRWVTPGDARTLAMSTAMQRALDAAFAQSPASGSGRAPPPVVG